MGKKQNPLNAGGVRREFTASSDFLAVLLNQRIVRPDNEMQALMESTPGSAEIVDKSKLQELREAVADCIDMLGERDIFIIDGIYSEKLTFQELSERLGYKDRSTILKRLKKIHVELKEHMTKHPVIQQWLESHE